MVLDSTNRKKLVATYRPSWSKIRRDSYLHTSYVTQSGATNAIILATATLSNSATETGNGTESKWLGKWRAAKRREIIVVADSPSRQLYPRSTNNSAIFLLPLPPNLSLRRAKFPRLVTNVEHCSLFPSSRSNLCDIFTFKRKFQVKRNSSALNKAGKICRFARPIDGVKNWWRCAGTSPSVGQIVRATFQSFRN